MAGLNNNANPIQSQVRLGPQLIQLVPGPPGPAGPAGGVVTTKVNFTQPAANANVTASFTTTSGFSAGVDLFIEGGGYYQIVSVTNSTDAVIQNLGTPAFGSFAGNTSPGLTVANGAIAATSGPATANPLPWSNGGHIQGHVDVTHASPGTLDATHQIAYCDTSTGTCQVTLPASPAADFEVLIIDTGGAAATSNIAVVPNGNNIWDPTALAFGTSNVSLATSGIAAWWKWDANKSHWTLINSGGGSGAVPAPASTISSNTTISAAQQWVLFTGAPGGYTITIQNMVAGVLYRFTHRGTAGGSTGIENANAVTFSRGTATFVIENPQDVGAATGNTQQVNVSNQTYHLMLDKTNNVVRCLGVS